MKEKELLEKLIPREPVKKRKPKWGLVLSGGGTKGAYEVGVWKALQELKIPLRGISGTSIGALNAAMFLCLDLKKIEEIYRNIRLTDVLPVTGNIDPTKDVFDPSNMRVIAKEFFARRGLDNAPLRNMLKTHLDIEKIYSSPLDLGIVTFNVKTREAFELFKEDIEKDKLIEYLLASANFPIYKVQNVDGKSFLDGGLFDNMPFNPLIERGYTHLIVADINGIGQTRKLENADKVFLKMISSSEPLGGTFEFNRERIKKNMKLGYLDTLKAFHKLFGSYFFFRRPSFNDLLLKFDLDTIWGLETAAKIYGMDRYYIYQAEEFLDDLENLYDATEQKYMQNSSTGLWNGVGVDHWKKILAEFGLTALIHSFTKYPVSRTGPLAKAFPDAADAANAIIALKNYRKL